ncbi:hypothetical protein CIHG_07575 [Coccidioides immitis H538.4]|uniref:Uncharacterized protein n=3 Tax=Coccidioides immitis TaxID=5501 RepID=A0A0J8R545_COCIT|nr:hypothetical protein CIRG_07867 [Coccidioides immitis RMSCC 2394]KMU79535.1 hypothetical protein CISG_01953 [Coccidioides immitis RMSCC 3703]KMU89892.1 hypothetical protein CIHG_07575 [Coccidioides immitis H538.4]
MKHAYVLHMGSQCTYRASRMHFSVCCIYKFFRHASCSAWMWWALHDLRHLRHESPAKTGWPSFLDKPRYREPDKRASEEERERNREIKPGERTYNWHPIASDPHQCR